MIRFDQSNWLLLLLLLKRNLRAHRPCRMLSNDMHVSNGFWPNLVLLYFDVLTTMNRCYSFMYHCSLTHDGLLILDRNSTCSGNLDGLRLLFSKHTWLLLLSWLTMSKLYRTLVNNFATTLQHRVSSGDLMMPRWCFVAVNDDLLRSSLWTRLIQRRKLVALFVNDLRGMWLLRLYLSRLAFGVGNNNLVRHSRRHRNVSHLMKIGRNIDQKVSTTGWMMYS